MGEPSGIPLRGAALTVNDPATRAAELRRGAKPD